MSHEAECPINDRDGVGVLHQRERRHERAGLVPLGHCAQCSEPRLDAERSLAVLLSLQEASVPLLGQLRHARDEHKSYTAPYLEKRSLRPARDSRGLLEPPAGGRGTRAVLSPSFKSLQSLRSLEPWDQCVKQPPRAPGVLRVTEPWREAYTSTKAPVV